MQTDDLSQKMTELFLSQDWVPQATETLALYASVTEEPDTRILAEALTVKKVRLFYPKTTSKTECILEMFPFFSGDSFKTGPYGIPEPSSATPFPAEELDFILCPGKLFGRSGERVGHGKGYYDRYLKRTSPNCIFFAFAFEAQIRENLIQKEWDVPVDAIFTERRVLATDRLTLKLKNRELNSKTRIK